MLVIAAAALALAACADEPTRPSEQAPRPDPDASLTAAAPLSFRQVSAGSGHTCGVSTGGTAYCWGDNSEGQLGIGNSAGPELCNTEFGNFACSTRPVRVVGGLAFRLVSAGGSHSCGVTTDDVAYCWGANADGQLGNGRTSPSPTKRPVRVVGGLAFRQVDARGPITCAVTTSNVAYCWGYNGNGELGNGTRNSSTRPVRVAGGLTFRSVRAGGCGVTTRNVAYCWGDNQYGEIGDGTTTRRLRPTRVTGGLAFRSVDGGGWDGATCGVTTGSAAYCWGVNFFGRLGSGSSTGPENCRDPYSGVGHPCSTRPVPVVGGLAFREVSAALFNSCGVTTSNVAYCWGSNLHGELGIGNNTGPGDCGGLPCSSRPVRVVGGLAFREVVAGEAHICGVTTSGRAYCWGESDLGQLGVGTSTGPESCGGIFCSTRPVAVVAPRP
jgi:alpha-tubulin suppressor-like RCC1 family protein